MESRMGVAPAPISRRRGRSLEVLSGEGGVGAFAGAVCSGVVTFGQGVVVGLDMGGLVGIWLWPRHGPISPVHSRALRICPDWVRSSG